MRVKFPTGEKDGISSSEDIGPTKTSRRLLEVRVNSEKPPALQSAAQWAGGERPTMWEGNIQKAFFSEY